MVGQLVLLMVQKSQTTTWDGAKNLVYNGMNYQPQLVIAGFQPSTVLYMSLLDHSGIYLTQFT